MIREHLKDDLGNSLPELLVSTAIVSLIATGVVLSFARLSTATLRLKTFHDQAYGISSTLAMLQEGMMNQDTHTLPFPPRIHRQTIKFYPPSLRTLTVDNRDETSHAITFLEVMPQSNFLVKKWFSPKSMEACNNTPFSWELIRSAIAISRDSFSEIAIEGTTLTSRNCYIINFTTPEMSLIAPQKMRILPTKIIPIKRTYTLYRATTGSLRYLSHLGPDIIENQPITHNSPVLKLQLKNNEVTKIYALQIEYTIAHRNPSEAVQIFTHVPRLSLSNNALNGF